MGTDFYLHCDTWEYRWDSACPDEVCTIGIDDDGAADQADPHCDGLPCAGGVCSGRLCQ